SAPDHRPGIGDMDGQLLSGVEQDIGQKALVPPKQDCRYEGSGEPHGLSGDFAAKFVFDVSAHNLLERALGRKAERSCATCFEPCRPAADDALDCGISFATDTRDHLSAGDAAQRLDLFANRTA